MGKVAVTYPCTSDPTFGASARAVPLAARFTVTEEPPSAGMVSGLPSFPLKLTINELGTVLVFVKYSAVYQPPPKANCGRIILVNGGGVATTLTASKTMPKPEWVTALNWSVVLAESAV